MNNRHVTYFPQNASKGSTAVRHAAWHGHGLVSSGSTHRGSAAQTRLVTVAAVEIALCRVDAI